MPTHYLNTDLDLTCAHDLSPLIAALRGRGLDALPHPTGRREGKFVVIFETYENFTTPEATLVAMLDAVESLPADMTALWQQCTQRDFNLGFQCDRQPHACEFAVAPELLQRIANLEARLCLTLYGGDGA